MRLGNRDPVLTLRWWLPRYQGPSAVGARQNPSGPWQNPVVLVAGTAVSVQWSHGTQDYTLKMKG